jgi:hypothetical protein
MPEHVNTQPKGKTYSSIQTSRRRFVVSDIADDLGKQTRPELPTNISVMKMAVYERSSCWGWERGSIGGFSQLVLRGGPGHQLFW